MHDARCERRIDELAQACVIGALLHEDGASPPVGKQALNFVVSRPGVTALAQLLVKQ